VAEDWVPLGKEETKQLGDLLTAMLIGTLYQADELPDFGTIQDVEVWHFDALGLVWVGPARR
jgi:hypothetical protein